MQLPRTGTMIRRVLASGAARGAGAAAGLLLSIVVARLVGVGGAGQFFYALTIIGLISKVTRWGYAFHILRFAAGPGEPGGQRRQLVVAQRAVLVVTAFSLLGGIGLALSGLGPLANLVAGPVGRENVGIFAAALTPFTLVWIYAAYYKAVRRPEWANFYESGVVPLLTVIFALSFGVTTTWQLGVAYLAAGIAVAVYATAELLRSAHRHRALTLRMPGLTWGLRFGLATTVVAVSNYLVQYAPFLALGQYASPDVVGGFSVAQRVVQVVNMIPLVVCSVYLPGFARAWEAGDFRLLRRMYRNTILFMVAGTAPLVAAIAIRPDLVMRLFGEGFDVGQMPLVILALGYFASMFLGPSEEILLMFGRAGSLRNIALGTLVAEWILVLVVVPRFLGEGAAAVTVVAFVARRLLAAVVVLRATAVAPGGRR